MNLSALTLAMILVQTVVTGVLTDSWLFPSISGAAAMLAWARPPGFQLTRRGEAYALVAVCMFFAVKMLIFPVEYEQRFSPFPNNYALNHALAQALLAVQIFGLAFRRFMLDQPLRFFSWRGLMPLLGAVQLGVVMDFVTRSNLHRLTAATGVFLFTLLLAAYVETTATRSRGARNSVFRIVVCAALLIAAPLAGTFLATLAAPNVMRLDALLFQFLRPSSITGGVGLSERSTLESVSDLRNKDNRRIVLRLEGNTVPDYLRVRVSDQLLGRSWQTLQSPSTRRPEPAPPSSLPLSDDENYFPFQPVAEVNRPPLAVWPAATANYLATTLNLTGIATVLPRIQVDGHGACKVDELPLSRPYLLFDGKPPPRYSPDPAILQACLSIPDSLTPEAREVCRSVLADRNTPREKIQAVVQYFRTHYHYHWGIEIPPNADPLSYFLTRKPPAHCEYFATAAVVMLRLGGVPARYVVGFVVSEKNQAGRYWVVRNRDAHAWVEAWDEERGWVTVEATPPDGLPQSTADDAWLARWDQIKFYARMVWARIREQQFRFVVSLISQGARWLYATWPGRFLAIFLLSIVAVHGGARRRAKRTVSCVSQEEMKFLRLLAQMDALARRHGFQREPGTTLLQFAAMLRAADAGDSWNQAVAAWYENATVLRFNGTPLSSVMEALSNQRENLPSRRINHP